MYAATKVTVKKEVEVIGGKSAPVKRRASGDVKPQPQLLPKTPMDYAGFERFHALLKADCNMMDRWSISGIMFDPIHKMKMIAISEMQISITGTVEIKRSVQVLNNSYWSK